MRAAEQRRKMRASQSMPIALLGMVCICCLSSSGCGVSEAAEEITRPDVISLAEMALLGEVDRASVQFPHDLHTDVMTERKEDCTLCHVVQDDGYLSATYKPLVDVGEQEAMDLYHENCIGCHQEIAGEGAKSRARRLRGLPSTPARLRIVSAAVRLRQLTSLSSCRGGQGRTARPVTMSTTRRRRSSSTQKARRAPAAIATARRRREPVGLQAGSASGLHRMSPRAPC